MPDLSTNTTLLVLARLSMILTAPAFAVIGWLLLRYVQTVDIIDTKVDEIRTQLVETNGSIKLSQQTLAAQGLLLADHETRIRALEHTSHPPQ